MNQLDYRGLIAKYTVCKLIYNILVKVNNIRVN